MSKQASEQYLNQPTSHWLGLLQSQDPVERRLAAYALGEVTGSAKSEAVEALTAAMSDSVHYVTVWAAASLARIDPTNQAALASLIAGTTDSVPFVRSLCAWHIGRLAGNVPSLESVQPHLERLLKDRSPSVKSEAGLALKRLQCRRTNRHC